MDTNNCSRVHDKKFNKIPDKYAIPQTYQTIFGHRIIVIILFNTMCGNACSMYEGTCCPVTLATGWKFM